MRARWPGWSARPSSALTSGSVVPGARSVIVTAHALQHRPSLLVGAAARCRPHFSLCLGRRLPRCAETSARRTARVDARGVARAVCGVRICRHGTGAGARLRSVRRPRLDRQEHLPDQPRPRLVAVSQRNHHHAGARARYAGAGAVRKLHALSRGVSDRRARRARSARLEPLPVLSHDRAPRRDAGGVSATRSARMSMAATSARRSVRTTSRPRTRPTMRGSRAADSISRRWWSSPGDPTRSGRRS